MLHANTEPQSTFQQYTADETQEKMTSHQCKAHKSKQENGGNVNFLDSSSSNRFVNYKCQQTEHTSRRGQNLFKWSLPSDLGKKPPCWL